MDRFEPISEPRDQRISEAEARAVVDRFLQQQPLDEPGVDVRTIATALRTSETDVLRLLAEVRTTVQGSHVRRRSLRTRLRDSAVALIAGLVFLTAVLSGGAWLWSIQDSAATESPGAYVDVVKFDVELGGARSELPARVNGLEIVKSADVKAIVAQTVEDMIGEELERNVWAPPKVDRRQLILAMESGDYSSPALAHLPLTLKGGSNGQFASGTKLPVYVGTDNEIQSWLTNERRRRIERALAGVESSARVQTGQAR